MSIPRKLTVIVAVLIVAALIVSLSFGCKREEQAGGEMKLFLIEWKLEVLLFLVP